MVYADTLRQNGRNEYALWFVSESAVCGLSDCGVLVECTMEIKAKGGVVKGVLREAGRGYASELTFYSERNLLIQRRTIKHMKQSWCRKCVQLWQETDSPIRQFLDTKKVERFLSSPSDYGKPWYGQLMAAPQMIAYLIQVNYWLEKYHIKIEL